MITLRNKSFSSKKDKAKNATKTAAGIGLGVAGGKVYRNRINKSKVLTKRLENRLERNREKYTVDPNLIRSQNITKILFNKDFIEKTKNLTTREKRELAEKEASKLAGNSTDAAKNGLRRAESLIERSRKLGKLSAIGKGVAVAGGSFLVGKSLLKKNVPS